MPRYKHYDYQQSILIPVNFDEQIMPGTLEHTINYLVEEKIDISMLETRFHNEETGAPAYDPKILLKIVLMAYSRGVVSLDVNIVVAFFMHIYSLAFLSSFCLG